MNLSSTINLNDLINELNKNCAVYLRLECSELNTISLIHLTALIFKILISSWDKNIAVQFLCCQGPHNAVYFFNILFKTYLHNADLMFKFSSATSKKKKDTIFKFGGKKNM